MKKQKTFFGWLSAIAVAIAAFVAQKAPAPPPAATPTPTVVATASPTATPSPSATPAPTVQATPTPPKPLPTPAPAWCGTPRGRCEEVNGGDFPFKSALTDAQRAAEAKFVVNGVITSEDGYMSEVILQLAKKGVCAERVQFDEVGIFNSLGLSFNVDIIAGEPGARFPFQKLAGRCRPAIEG